jgi:hypothetical protein
LDNANATNRSCAGHGIAATNTKGSLMKRLARNEGDRMTAITRKPITPQPVMQLARVLADADGMMEITNNDLVECGYVAMARAALDHLQSLNTTDCDKP